MKLAYLQSNSRANLDRICEAEILQIPWLPEATRRDGSSLSLALRRFPSAY